MAGSPAAGPDPARPSAAATHRGGLVLTACFAVGWWLVGHRGLDFTASLAVHLVTTAVYVACCRPFVGAAAGAPRLDWRVAFGVAVALRLAAAPMTPELSDDLFRYLWEGRLVLLGENPYLVPPDDPSLVALRVQDGADGAYWERINNKEIPAVYPPAVQYVLAAAVALSPQPWGMGVVMASFDLLAFGFLWAFLARRGEPPGRAILYGWCPLVVLEYAGEAHSDCIANAFLACALWATTLRGGFAASVAAGAALAGAVAAKLYPVVLLPFLLRDLARRPGADRAGATSEPAAGGAGRRRRPVTATALLPASAAFFAALVLLYLPFVPADDPVRLLRGTTEYASRWRSNESAYALIHETVHWLHGHGLVQWLDPYGLLRDEVQRLAKLPVAAGLMLVLGWTWRAGASLPGAGLAVMLYVTALTPTLHPWYVGLLALWVAAGPPGGRLWMAVFTGTVFLAYHVLPRWLLAGVWEERAWVRLPEYLPFYAGIWAYARAASRRQRVGTSTR